MTDEPRFECRRDIGPDDWMVWDNVGNAAASLGGCMLRGRTEHRARAACDILTAIYRSGLDCASLRKKLAASLRERAPLN